MSFVYFYCVSVYITRKCFTYIGFVSCITTAFKLNLVMTNNIIVILISINTMHNCARLSATETYSRRPLIQTAPLCCTRLAVTHIYKKFVYLLHCSNCIKCCAANHMLLLMQVLLYLLCSLKKQTTLVMVLLVYWDGVQFPTVSC